MLTNKVNGKRYIGQSQQEDVKRRWSAYNNVKKKSIGTVLYRALLKYKTESFKFQIICVCFNEDCNKYEVEYIKKYNSMTPNGYNMQDGGTNPLATCRKKIVLSEEQREKMKGRFIGEKSCNFGKQMTDEQKAKISKTLRERYKNTEPTKRGPREHKSYIVEKYSESRVLIETFSSLSSAAATINTSPPVIKKYANTEILYRGFYWKSTEVPSKKPGENP